MLNIFYIYTLPLKYIWYPLLFGNISHNFYHFTFLILLLNVLSQYCTHVNHLLKWLLIIQVNPLPTCFVFVYLAGLLYLWYLSYVDLV